MTLPTTGSMTMTMINGEFGLGRVLGNYRGVAWEKPPVPGDTGPYSGTFSTTNIAMGEFFGKKPAPTYSYVNPLSFPNSPYEVVAFAGNLASIELTFLSDGTWQIDSSQDFWQGAWTAPASIGNYSFATGKYIKFTRTSATIPTMGGASPTSSWVSISSGTGNAAKITVYSNTPVVGVSTITTATYTVQIATDSGGVNIVSTGSLTLRAVASSSPEP